MNSNAETIDAAMKAVRPSLPIGVTLTKGEWAERQYYLKFTIESSVVAGDVGTVRSAVQLLMQNIRVDYKIEEDRQPEDTRRPFAGDDRDPPFFAV